MVALPNRPLLVDVNAASGVVSVVLPEVDDDELPEVLLDEELLVDELPLPELPPVEPVELLLLVELLPEVEELLPDVLLVLEVAEA